jgi:tRNA(His) 5'-end guanylyltransferase
MKDALGDRMKNNYEQAYSSYLPWRTPVIIRIDGRAFHTFTKGMKRPFDDEFMASMNLLAINLCTEIDTVRFAYTQSDEISLLLHSYNKHASQPWFGNEIQKMVSISASLAASIFGLLYNKVVTFDSRCFALPEDEVCNYFIWRQQDAIRNSIQMVARSHYSHKQLHTKNCEEMLEMVKETGDDWNAYSLRYRRGRACMKDSRGWLIYNDLPLFTENRNYINRWLETEE